MVCGARRVKENARGKKRGEEIVVVMVVVKWNGGKDAYAHYHRFICAFGGVELKILPS